MDASDRAHGLVSLSADESLDLRLSAARHASSVTLDNGASSSDVHSNLTDNGNYNDELLDAFNRDQAILHLPLTSFLALLMLVGVTGNLCVVYVYRTRYRKTAGSYFIMVLGVVDLATSALCISWDIFRLSSPYKHHSEVLCKLARFVQSFLCLSAAIVLVCVAFSRYYKIVKPLQCYSSGQAQSLTVVAMAIALSVVWPQLLLSGIQDVRVGRGDVYGQTCDVTYKMRDSFFTLLFHGVLYLVFILCFVLMLVFYLHITCVVCSLGGGPLRSQLGPTSRDRTPRSSASSNASERSFGSSQNLSVTSRSQAGVARSTTHRNHDSLANNSNHRHHHRHHHNNSSGLCSVFRRVGRTTRMLSLVTFVFLLGYLPFITVHILSFLEVAFHRPLSYQHQMAYQLCLRSYFLSSAANPLIYSILNSRFREQSMVALRSFLMQLPSWIRKRVKGHHDLRR